MLNIQSTGVKYRL
ncbi:hypothetical protein YPPY64_1728, partial [Yersinia pestis PY-64]